jgi:hypothetical protein
VAAEYSFNISTSHRYQEIADSVSEKFGFALSSNEAYVVLHIDLPEPGLIITLTDLSSRSQNLYEEVFDYLPTVHVGFRLQVNSRKEKEEQYRQNEEMKSLMMQTVIYLLEQESGDAVFLFNGEITVLQRFKGELSLSEKYFGPGKPGAFPLELVTLPYKIVPIVSLLL